MSIKDLMEDTDWNTYDPISALVYSSRTWSLQHLSAYLKSNAMTLRRTSRSRRWLVGIGMFPLLQQCFSLLEKLLAIF